MNKVLVSAASVLVLGALAPAFCRGGTLNSGNLNFQTSNQSMWSPGADATTYPIFSVDQSLNFNQSFGGIQQTQICFFGSCVPTGYQGAQITASINGDIGANLNMTLTGGSVNAAVPVNVTLGFPSTVSNNTPFNITSSGLFQPGASLNTFSPGVDLSMNVLGNLSGGINGQVCVVACASGGVNFTTNGPQTLNLFTTNLAGVLNKSINISPYLVAQIGFPYVNTSGTPGVQPFPSSCPSPCLTIGSNGVSKSFFSLQANISNIIATGLGLPFPSGSFGVGSVSVNYTLFQFLAGLGLDSTQAFTLTATPEVSYAVQYIGSDPLSFTTSNMDVGAPFQLSIPAGDTAADITPSYTMAATLANQTGIVPAIDLTFQALKLSAFGIGTPYLINQGLSFQLNNADIPLFNQNFSLGGWNTVQGNTFEITASTPAVSTPEPGTLTPLGSGLLLLAMASFVRRLRAGKQTS
jgi:hypothetical protein